MAIVSTICLPQLHRLYQYKFQIVYDLRWRINFTRYNAAKVQKRTVPLVYSETSFIFPPVRVIFSFDPAQLAFHLHHHLNARLLCLGC